MLISYAQNLEDVLLWRALGSLSKGFYIDVGAWHPERDSVTKCFYDAGWRGINIEPDDHMFAQLVTHRERDINLKVALANVTSSMVLFQIGDNTGLSTICRDTMMMHKAAGLSIVEKEVISSTLSSICDNYSPAEIHFLKIDVEGAEHSVLQGADFDRFRPWIIIIEATVPLTLTPCFDSWEPLLFDSNYEYVYTDGINRFYVCKEQLATLKSAFRFPPNVFDRYVRASDRYFWQNSN
jgi:FkbM family methyltransferase